MDKEKLKSWMCFIFGTSILIFFAYSIINFDINMWSTFLNSLTSFEQFMFVIAFSGWVGCLMFFIVITLRAFKNIIRSD